MWVGKEGCSLHPLLSAEGVEWREGHSLSPIGSVDWKGGLFHILVEGMGWREADPYPLLLVKVWCRRMSPTFMDQKEGHSMSPTFSEDHEVKRRPALHSLLQVGDVDWGWSCLTVGWVFKVN